MKKFVQFLSGSEDFELVFDVPIETAVERLNTDVRELSLSIRRHEGMVGRADQKYVRIHRVIPMVQNSFKPVLVGSFTEQGGKTVLSGVFRFHQIVQIFMAIWFGMNILFVVFSSAAVINKPSELWLMPLIGVLMFFFGIGMIKAGTWFSRNDKNWLMEKQQVDQNEIVKRSGWDRANEEAI